MVKVPSIIKIPVVQALIAPVHPWIELILDVFFEFRVAATEYLLCLFILRRTVKGLDHDLPHLDLYPVHRVDLCPVFSVLVPPLLVQLEVLFIFLPNRVRIVYRILLNSLHYRVSVQNVVFFRLFRRLAGVICSVKLTHHGLAWPANFLNSTSPSGVHPKIRQVFCLTALAAYPQ